MSSKPLVERLGYLPGQKVFIEGGPKSVLAEFEYAGIHLVEDLPADWAHAFVAHEKALRTLMTTWDLEEISHGIWISWPKKSSGVTTDLTEQTLRDVILPLGWVDVKVCAIDDIWSGLKFVERKQEV